MVIRERVRAAAMLLLAAFSMVTVWGCETVEGAGRDLESAGDAIEEEAQEHD